MIPPAAEPSGARAALLLGACALVGVGVFACLYLLRDSPEPSHRMTAGHAPPIQEQLNIDDLVLRPRKVAAAADLAAPTSVAMPTPGDGQRVVVPADHYRKRDAEVERLRAELEAANPERFEARVYRDADGTTLPYRLFRPRGHDQPGRTFPLVLVLHGSSARGTDNLAQLRGPSALAAGVFTLALHQARQPCFVMAPQCPPEPARWAENGDWAAPSHRRAEAMAEPLRLALAALDQVCAELPVDRSRLYVVGHSMGAFGALDLLTRQPTRFAAAVAVAGGLAEGEARAIRHVPLWLFHGGDDPVVPASRSRDAFAALLGVGGRPRYTEYEGLGHEAWRYAFTEPGLGEWMFARKLAGGVPTSAPAATDDGRVEPR